MSLNPASPPAQPDKKAAKAAAKEAERVAALEAAAAEEERLRLEEIERKKREAEDAVFEVEEAERVVAAEAELAAQTDEFVAFEAQQADHLARLRDEEKVAYDWERFSACCARPDPREEKEMLAYETSVLEGDPTSLGAALDVAQDHELIIREAELYRDWTLAEGRSDEANALAACGGRVRALTDVVVDRATAYLLHTADKHQNEDGEIMIHDARPGFKYALWLNHVKNPRFKAIEVPELGNLTLELPKPVVLATVGVRAFHKSSDALDVNPAEVDVSVGGTLTLDLLTLPPLPEVARGWTMRPVTPMARQIKRLPYPIPAAGAEEESANEVDVDAPPVVVSLELPKTVLLAEAKPRVGWWDSAESRWRTEGVTGVSVVGRRLKFSSVKFARLSLPQSRVAMLPYQSWRVSPSADGETCVLSVKPGNPRFADGGIDIEAGDGWCRLVGSGVDELSSLMGEKMRPRALLDRLAACGARLSPNDADAERVGVTRKDERLELECCKDVALMAPSFAVASCRWNRDVGAEDALARFAEVVDYDLISPEDLDKIFLRERDGTVKTLLRKTKGVTVVDARHRHGELSRSARVHMEDGRERTGAAAVRARMEGFDAPIPPAEYRLTARTLVAAAATETSARRMAEAAPAFTDTVTTLLSLTRVFTFG